MLLGLRKKKAFALQAQQYHEAGFVPFPLVFGHLVPALRDLAAYADGVPAEKVKSWINAWELADAELGLVFGTRHGEHRLVAVVVRDPALIPDVTAALGAIPCAVRTPDRLTIFAIASFDLRLRRFRRRDPRGKWEAARLTVEGRGCYAVIPPTKLPRGQPCSWVGKPILEVGTENLPRLTAWTLDELQTIVDGPGEPFRTLNALGPEGGDEGCRAAVVGLVARRWPDDAVLARVQWAGRTVDGGPADTSPVQNWIDRIRRAGVRPDEATKRWLEARARVPTTRSERADWWTRSSEAYADCQAWAESEGYPAPHKVVWGTTLTRLGIKSAVRKMGGQSVRMRNLSLRLADR